jgi:hypothetical protein
MFQNLDEPKVRFRGACESVEMYISSSVCKETDYRLDVCRITNGTHVEIRQVAMKNKKVGVLFFHSTDIIIIHNLIFLE